MTYFYYKNQELITTDDQMDSRAFAYGDGFFSTLGVRDGQILWQAWHAWRIERSARAFELDVDVADVMACLSELGKKTGEGTLKLIITRSPQDVRGYGFMDKTAQIYLKSTPNPIYQGIEFKHNFPIQPTEQALCLTEMLGIRPPRFAGVKLIGCHEQVFAHRELLTKQAFFPLTAEGLVKNTLGEWISGTMNNVCYRLDGRWYTPPVDKSGVAGTVRQALLAHHRLTERLLGDDDLPRLTGLFFCNAVRGVMPIHTLFTRDDTLYLDPYAHLSLLS